MAVVEWRATCGTKNANIKCNRPNWDKIKNAYEKINTLPIADRYALVSKEALKAHEEGLSGYQNSCAIQISYTLNQNGMYLENYLSSEIIKQPDDLKDDSILIGKDKHNYIIRVKTLIKLFELKNFFGNADEPYNPKLMKTKTDNTNFYNNELSKFNKNGFVAIEIEGWGNAKGHITIWDGSKHKFLDDNDINDSKNYLTKIDGIDKYGRQIPVVTKFYFWELI